MDIFLLILVFNLKIKSINLEKLTNTNKNNCIGGKDE